MLDDYQPQQQERKRRNKTRRERTASRRQAARSEPGGFALHCRCRWVRTGGLWRQVWPCSSAHLSGPLPDEHMNTLMQAP